MRLFFAIELPSTVQHALAKLQPAANWARDYRWVDPASMHITLAFLGEQPESALEPLTHIGQTAAASSKPGKLTIAMPGSFGPRQAPRVLWVGLSGDLETLHHLQSALGDALRQHRFPVEARNFSPHITLARRRERAASGSPPLWPPTIQSQQPLSVPLKQLTLFQSHLSPAGARYTPVAHWPIDRA